MTALLIHAIGPTGHKQRFFYDPQASTFTFEDGTNVPFRPLKEPKKASTVPAVKISAKAPGRKSKKITRLKIQMGLSCNYSCGYCNQKHVPHADQTTHADVAPFLAQLPTWLEPKDQFIVEFWGGEPLVYWKTLQPLAEEIRARYPLAAFSVITNGALLTREKNEWLDRLGFQVAVSHDGPAQTTRGEDPLEDPTSRDAIMDLFARLHPQHRVSFNTMLHRKNVDRTALQVFFKELTGADDVVIGEGGVIDAYDDAGMELLFQDGEHYMARAKLFADIADGSASNFMAVRDRIVELVDSIATRRQAKTLGQKCAMERDDYIAVDLKGNVLTCQNMSNVAIAPNGHPHKIGHVSEFDKIEMRTSTHWAHRSDCPTCPVLQLCKGSCMFLEGDNFEQSCESSYDVNIAYFVAAFEYITNGYRPVFIDGPGIPDHRKDIWGGVFEGRLPPTKKRKPFPIPVVQADAAPAVNVQPDLFEGETK
jgi:uncharacterized protein